VAYQEPAFMVNHAFAEAVLDGGLAVITAANAWSGTADITKRRLCDYRLAALADFAASLATHYVQIDRSASIGSNIGHVIIPSGHNFAGAGMRIRGASDSGITADVVTLLADDTAVPAGLFESDLVGSPDGVSRYIRSDWLNDTGQWEIPELWLGEKKSTTTGIATAWSNPLETPLVEQPFPTRDAAVILGPARRTWEIEHVHLDATDVAIYDEVLATGRTVPFWFWAPDDSYTEPFLMKLIDDGDREQDSTVPKTEVTYTVRLRMREQTT
jgi:hypothetical protein